MPHRDDFSTDIPAVPDNPQSPIHVPGPSSPGAGHDHYGATDLHDHADLSDHAQDDDHSHVQHAGSDLSRQYVPVTGYQRAPRPDFIATGDTTVDSLVDGLIMNNIYTSGTVLTYTFDLIAGLQADPNWSKLNAAAIERHLDMFDMFTNMTGVELVEVDPSKQNANLYFAFREGTATAYVTSLNGGVIHVYNPDRPDPVLGNYTDHLMLHEFGHGLGLAHGHHDGTLPDEFQGHSWSVMSYRAHPETNSLFFSDTHGPETFMLADLAALQYQFGANFKAFGGDTTYTVNFDTGEFLIDGISQGVPRNNQMLRTVWDGDGVDTLDLSNAVQSLSIDLRPGAFTSFGPGYLSYQSSDPTGQALFAEGNIANPYLYQGNTQSLLENAIGSVFSDIIIGNQVDNTLWGGAGSDEIDGAEGQDVLHGDAGSDILSGGAGFDTLHGGSGGDRLSGGSGADTIYGGGGDDFIFGNTGVDEIHGGAGNDDISTGEGADIAYGDFGDDRIIGRSGYDELYGGHGADHLLGSAGNDQLYGDAGDDLLEGGTALDTLHGGFGADRLYGNSGADTIYGDAGEDQLFGGSGIDRLFGGTENDVLYGMAGSDIINGDRGADRLFGGSGNDRLNGGDGDDLLQGNQGLDILNGGAGDDILRGGTLADTFVFDFGDGHDVIEDFNLSVDTLLLDTRLVEFLADAVKLVDALFISMGEAQSLTLNGLSDVDDLMARTQVMDLMA